MIRDFQSIEDRVRSRERQPLVAIAAPQGDAEILEAVAEAERLGIAAFRLIDDADEAAAAARAVALVRSGAADVLMKGKLNSTPFLRAVLQAEKAERPTAILSHMAAFEVPGQDRLLFFTDGGMTIAPDLDMKRLLLGNALAALRAMGIPSPKVAVLTANELVNPKMPATVDAAALAELAQAGAFGDCLVEGPVSMDVALDCEAAERKGLQSRICGRADLFLLPNIEAGNILGKALVHFAGARMAGIVLGASYPIVMTSRAESARGKLDSIALACLGVR